MRKFLMLLILLFTLSSLLHSEETMTKEDEARFGSAQSLNNLGRYDEAIKILKELYSRYPEDKRVSVELAKALGYGKRLDEARVLLDRLERRYPQDEYIRYTYATVLEANQSFIEAKDRYLQLLKRDPDNEALQLKMAEISSWLGDYETSIKYYKILIATQGEIPSLKMKLADVYFWARDYEEAIELYRDLKIGPSSDKERFKYLGDAYLGSGQYDKAIEIYKRLLEIYPQEIAFRADIANVMLASGRADEAEREFEDIIRESPQDTRAMLKLADIFAMRQKYEDAIKICKDILSIDPEEREAMLYLARFLSWKKDYGESLDLYEKIIEKHPQWTIPRREKARVLGWTRKYKESIDRYREIFEKIGPDEPSNLEISSKNAFYKRFDKKAIIEYNNWLKVEPDDLEALYDLGQLYGRQMQWDNARKIYERVLKIMPAHFRAKEALNKVDIYSKLPMVESGFEFFDAGSGSRHVDKQYYNIYSGLKVPLMKDLYFKIREDTFIYHFPDVFWVNRQRFSSVIEYYKKPIFWAKAGYGYSIYSDKIDNSHNFNEEINVKPFDMATFTLSHEREDVIENPKTLKMNLQKDDYKSRLTLDINRRISLGADYIYSRFTDRNCKNTFGVDSCLMVLYEPTILKIYYRYEYYGFTHKKDYIFSPNNFYFNKLSLEWRHYLNREELFWGTNDTYYTLRYSINFDSTDPQGHILYADIYRDWNDRFTTSMEWSKIIYHPKDTYSEDRVMLYTRYYF